MKSIIWNLSYDKVQACEIRTWRSNFLRWIYFSICFHVCCILIRETPIVYAVFMKCNQSVWAISYTTRSFTSLTVFFFHHLFLYFCIAVVTWQKYCRYGVKHKTINQSLFQPTFQSFNFPIWVKNSRRNPYKQTNKQTNKPFILLNML